MPTPLLNATSQAAQAARAAQLGANAVTARDEPNSIVFDRHTPLFSREVDAALIRSVNALRFADRAPADATPGAAPASESATSTPDWSQAFGKGEVADLTARRAAHAERWQALEQRYPYLAAEPLVTTPPSEPQPGAAPGPYVSPAAEPIGSRTETLPTEPLSPILTGRPAAVPTPPALDGFPVAEPLGHILFNESFKGEDGRLTVTERAREFAAKSKNETQNLDKLIATGTELTRRGFDVTIEGESSEGGIKELKLTGHGFDQVEAESKRLKGNQPRTARDAIRYGTRQAGDGGTVVIDGTQAGMTPEAFEQGLADFLRNSVPSRLDTREPGATGQIIFLYGDKGLMIVEF